MATTLSAPTQEQCAKFTTLMLNMHQVFWYKALNRRLCSCGLVPRECAAQVLFNRLDIHVKTHEV
jgi:hypothetical protein